MKLLLARHGEATSALSDPKQPLSIQGIKEIESAANFLKRISIQPEAIFHSSKLRAKQTALIYQKHLSAAISLYEKAFINPNDPIDDLLTFLPNYECLLIVSHLPYLETLMQFLLFKKTMFPFFNFTTGSLICLESQEGNWSLGFAIAGNTFLKLPESFLDSYDE